MLFRSHTRKTFNLEIFLTTSSDVEPSNEALQLFEQADSLLEGSTEEHQQALNLLSEYENEYSNNVEFLWRLAKCCRMVSQGYSDDKSKKELCFKGD